MKSHTSEFKEEIKLLGKQQDVRITYTINDEQIVLSSEDINSATPNYEASLLKSVMKGLDLDSNVDIPLGTQIKFEYGLLVNGVYEYLNYGNYIVYSSEKQEDTLSYKITCYDKMLYSMKDYEHIDITYPCTIKQYLIALCNKIGLQFKDSDFANENRQITSELFMTINEDGTYSSMGYTYRDVLDQIAETTGGCICITLDDKVEVRYINKALEYSTSKNTNEVEIETQVKEKVKTINIDGNSYQGESPSPDNPQEIKNVGENGIKIKQSGKNLFDKSAVTKGYELNSVTGQLLSNNDWYTSDYIEVNNLNKIHLSSTGKTRGNSNCFYDKDKKFIKSQTGINNVSLSVPENAYYLRFNGLITQLDNDIQIEKGTEATSYEPYHEPIITPINLQGNTLSKIGDVKAILKVNKNGEVEIKKNIEKIVLTGEENLIDNSSTSTRKYWGIDFSNYGIYQYNDPTKVCDVLTTKFKSRPQQGSFLPGQVALMTDSKNVFFIFEPDTTEEQARAILKDMPVYFRLAEPQTIKLSSISPIELWQGTNIFSLVTNLDTEIELEYPTNYDTIDEEYINDTNVNFGEKYRTNQFNCACKSRRK